MDNRYANRDIWETKTWDSGANVGTGGLQPTVRVQGSPVAKMFGKRWYGAAALAAGGLHIELHRSSCRPAEAETYEFWIAVA